ASLGADLDEAVVDTKTSPNDLVTLADAQIEALVRGYLSAVRPGDVMVGEEGAEAIDPVEFFDRDLLRRLAAFDPVAGALAEAGSEGRFE
ncbi:inositol-phosphate phosphatase, partial [Burkholderia multivorans]